MGIDAPRKTPLNALHRELGGQMVEFAGWDMPVMYSGIVAEHMAVRERAGLFDTSHMARFFLSGPGAANFLQRTLTNDISGLDDGQGHYTLALNGQGGVRDDLIVFRLGREFMVIANASNRGKIWGHLRSLAGPEVAMRDRSDELAMIALQGPKAEAVAARVAPEAPGIGRFELKEAGIAGGRVLVSRTGYTGEDGFEFYPEAGRATAVWRALLEAGKDLPVVSCGLGARDGLRLEMGYSLYGHEIDEETFPVEANLGWVVKMGKGDFLGRKALEEGKKAGVGRRLVGFTCAGPGVPRQGCTLTIGGREAGKVSSGTFSPRLRTGIGLGFVSGGDGEMAVVVRGKSLAAAPTVPPFYKGGSVHGPRKS